MQVVDLFPFQNELDVLEWRLRELEGVVDRHVACEATRTFRGVAKPLHLEAALGRYAQWPLEKLTCDHLPHWPNIPHETRMYEVEGIQRDHLMDAVYFLDGEDLVLVSDVDELPSAGVLRWVIAEYFAGRLKLPVKFRQRLFYYALDLEFPHEPPWYGTRLLKVSQLRRIGVMAARILECRPVPLPGWHGWHFSFFGGEEVMVEKVRAWSHASAFIPEPLDPVGYMREARLTGQDWDPRRRASLRRVEVDDSFPAWVVANLGALRHHTIAGMVEGGVGDGAGDAVTLPGG